jgi:hypothetical protein
MEEKKGADGLTVYLCLDDRNGLLFNGRRLSRDAHLLADMAAMVPENLTIDPFSEKLITAAGIPYVLAGEDIPEDAHFFLENRNPEDLLPAAKVLVLYRWNRHYPSDFRWEGSPADHGFLLSESSEFSGKSHDIITKEVYVK